MRHVFDHRAVSEHVQANVAALQLVAVAAAVKAKVRTIRVFKDAKTSSRCSLTEIINCRLGGAAIGVILNVQVDSRQLRFKTGFIRVLQRPVDRLNGATINRQYRNGVCQRRAGHRQITRRTLPDHQTGRINPRCASFAPDHDIAIFHRHRGGRVDAWNGRRPCRLRASERKAGKRTVVHHREKGVVLLPIAGLRENRPHAIDCYGGGGIEERGLFKSRDIQIRHRPRHFEGEPR